MNLDFGKKSQKETNFEILRKRRNFVRWICYDWL